MLKIRILPWASWALLALSVLSVLLASWALLGLSVLLASSEDRLASNRR